MFVESSDAPGLATNPGTADAVVEATFIVPTSGARPRQRPFESTTLNPSTATAASRRAARFIGPPSDDPLASYRGG